MRFTGLLVAMALLLGMAACEQQPASTTEQISDKLSDALDNRPNGKIRDALEELRDGAKNAVQALK